MIALCFLLAFFAGPFWETAPPEQWSDQEIYTLLHHSPWARQEEGTEIYLASALPAREAERELRRRRAPKDPADESPLEDEEYREFMSQYPGEYIVLAVRVPKPSYLENERDVQAMAKKSVLKAGKKKYRMVGHFPPVPGDPYLRLVFPRVEVPENHLLVFQLYVPGVPMPFRRLIFDTRQMIYKGKLEL